MVVKQFDLCANPSDRSADVAPYLIVLSAHHTLGLEEVIVAPVIRSGVLAPNAVDVTVRISEEIYVVSVVGLAAIRRQLLRQRIGNAAAYEDDIRRALDRLFTGF